MASEAFTVSVGKEMLTGAIEWSPSKAPPSLLLLHGAGSGNAPRWQPTAEHLAARGVTSVRFNFSGHEDSSGTMRESSLPKRVDEAQALAERFFGQSGPPFIAGSSMGGPVAARLATMFPAQSLILLCPAAYARAAEDVTFDERFTAILRSPESWRDSRTWDDVKAFKGDLLHIIGEHDAVIPQGVTDGYRRFAVNVRSARFEVIPGADHNLNLWLNGHPAERERVWGMMENAMNLAPKPPATRADPYKR